MKTRLYIWVTSDCNLSCPYCSQAYTMRQHKGYQMDLQEIHSIVNSCKERGLYFDIIEITGGEPSLWKNIEEGVKLFAEICDMVTLATNGNNPELILSLGLKTWIVSASQATPKQMKKYEPVKHKLTINSHTHKKAPDHPVFNSLPAICCSRVTPQGEAQVSMQYLKGNVYYCCDAFAHTEYVEESDSIVCSFEDDFLVKYKDKKYDQKICQYCLCNQNVWKTI